MQAGRSTVDVPGFGIVSLGCRVMGLKASGGVLQEGSSRRANAAMGLKALSLAAAMEGPRNHGE